MTDDMLYSDDYDHSSVARQPARRLDRWESTGNITSVRSPIDISVITGLTPTKLIDVLRRAAQGDHADYLRAAAEMQRRDLHYAGVLGNRLRAITNLSASIVPARGGEGDPATRACEDLIKSAAFRAMLIHVLDAIAKGFSVVEILWQLTEELWSPVEYKFRFAHWFHFDPDTFEELRLYDSTLEGLPLTKWKYLVHQPAITSGLPLAGGLARGVMAMHLFKGYLIKSLMAFAEVFGLPLRVGKYPASATNKERDELKRAVTAIGSDAAAVIANTMAIEFIRANASGNAGSDRFFMEAADWFDRQVSKYVLGQVGTTEEKTGSVYGAKVQNEVRGEIKCSDARELEATINLQLLKPFVDFNFGVRSSEFEYPRFQLDTRESVDLEMLSRALPPLVAVGFRVPVRPLYERFGFTEPQPGEEVLQAPKVPTVDTKAKESAKKGTKSS